MVLAVAALLLQLTSTPEVVGPLFTANSITTTADGTKLKPAVAATVNSATDTIKALSGKGYIDPDAVSLSGDSGGKPVPGMTAVSLTDHESSQPLALVRIVEPAPVKPIKVYSAETPRMSHSWLALVIMQDDPLQLSLPDQTDHLGARRHADMRMTLDLVDQVPRHRGGK